MATVPRTLSEMLQRPYVIGVYSRIKPAGIALSSFYRMRSMDTATEPGNMSRTIVYDIFNNSRVAANARAPMIAPARKQPKPIGQAQATAIRLYESMPYPYEKVQSIRPVGGSFAGRLDQRGRSWVALQMRYQAQRFENAVEFMVSRIFRGGFSVDIEGDDYILKELGAGDFDVSYSLPASNTGNLGGIIDADWDVSTTKIVNHMLAINKQAELLCGYPIRHVWINSTTYSYMLANTQLNQVRGTVARVFDNFVPTNQPTTNGEREIGFTVQFLAIPQFLFHVYDAVSVVGTDFDPDTPTTGNSSLYVPDGKAIMTPDPAPGDWHGMFHGSEFVRKGGNHVPASVVTGWDSWTNPLDHPPGEALTMIHNLVPLLYVPSAVYYATVKS